MVRTSARRSVVRSQLENARNAIPPSPESDPDVSFGQTTNWALERRSRNNLLDRMEAEGEALQQAGKFVEAVAIYEQVLREVGDNKVAFLEIARCYEKMHKLEHAFSVMQKAVSLIKDSEEGDESLDLWIVFGRLANLLKKPRDVIQAMKGMVTIHEKAELTGGDYLHLMRQLVELLELDDDGTLLYYQTRLLDAEKAARSPPGDILVLVIKVATKWLATGKSEQAIEQLRSALHCILLDKDHLFVPLDVVVQGITVFGEASIQEALLNRTDKDSVGKNAQQTRLSHFQMILKYSWGYNLLKSARNGQKNVIICDFLRKNSSFASTICIAAISSGQDFALVENIIKRLRLNDDSGKYVSTLLKLIKVLLENDQAELAKSMLQDYQSRFSEFKIEEAYMLLGDIWQNLDDIPQAKNAYQKVLDIRSNNRIAKHRFNRLGFEFPNKCVTVGEKARARNLGYQVSLISRFHSAMAVEEAHRNNEDIVQIVHDLMSSTFDKFSVHIDPHVYLWDLSTPYTLERALKTYTLHSPAIAAKKVKVDELFVIVLIGCEIAYKLKKYDEVVNIAFLAIRHKDFYDAPEKLTRLKMAIAVVAYYLDVKSRSGETINTRRFTLEYLRGDLNRLKPQIFHTFGIAKYNLYHLLVQEEARVDCKSAVNKCSKWGNHFLKKKGFCLEVSMVMANEAMRRGSIEKCYELYLEIVNHLGEENVHWQIWLNMGIASVNIALRYDCPAGLRCSIYSRGMLFLEKYGQLRGNCPEVWFNKARAAQNFGDVGSAVRFYVICLELCKRTLVPRDHLLIDLTFRAAYNLRALFAGQKQFMLCKQIDDEYLNWKNVKRLSNFEN